MLWRDWLPTVFNIYLVWNSWKLIRIVQAMMHIYFLFQFGRSHHWGTDWKWWVFIIWAFPWEAEVVLMAVELCKNSASLNFLLFWNNVYPLVKCFTVKLLMYHGYCFSLYIKSVYKRNWQFQKSIDKRNLFKVLTLMINRFLKKIRCSINLSLHS